MATKVITALNAVSATTTSTNIFVGDYDHVALVFRGANISTGNGVFTVKGGFAQLPSTDPTMVALNTLIDNVTNTNVQTLVRVNSKTISANGDVIVWLSPETPVTHLNITCTRTTDGTYTALVVGFTDED